MKKIVLIQMEGNLDRSTLSISLEHERKENNIRYYIEYGDFITNSNNKVNNQNIVTKLQKKINDEFSKIMKQEKVEVSDLDMIIYMTDTDNCFNSETDTLINKAECLKVLASIETLKIRKSDIPFRVILMSTNLEKVLYGVDYSYLSKQEANRKKIQHSIEFSTICRRRPLHLRETLSSQQIQKWPSYGAFRLDYMNCSKRATNLDLLIDKKL